MRRAASRAAPAGRHEPTRRQLLRLAVALACVAVVLGLAHAGLALWANVHAGGPPPRAVAPPPVQAAAEPASAPAPDYRWIDRAAGVAEIPVERAMRLVAVGGGGRADDGSGGGGARPGGRREDPR
jgi:hypothetical protein